MNMTADDLVDLIASAIEGYDDDLDRYIDVATIGPKLRVRIYNSDTGETEAAFMATFEKVEQ